jgi:hypothetical protein
MEDLGPETIADRNLREWFDEQERTNLNRLEDGAKTISQLITALYSVLFAVLALNSQPTPVYMKDVMVHWIGSISLVSLFISLIGSLAVTYPSKVSIQEDNLSSMKRSLKHLQQRKLWALRVSVCFFLLGMSNLGLLILWVLWHFSK